MTLLPKKKERKYLSFLFCDSGVKIAKIEEKKGQKSLITLEESSLPAGLIVDSEVKDTEKLGNFLADLKLKLGLKEDLVVVGLQETKAFVHTLSLPNLAPNEIDQAIEYQADSFLPFPYQNEYIDWMFLENQHNGKIKILVSAIPKNIIDGYVASFHKAGLNPVAFEPTSLSLLRLVPANERRLSLVTEIAEFMSILVINKEGVVETSSIVSDRNLYLPTIKKISEYYFKAEKDPEKQPKIYICGKGANSEMIEQLKSLKIEVITLKTNVEGVPAGRELELATLLSLAQKTVASPSDASTINILPPTIVEQYELVSSEKKEKGFNFLFLAFLIFVNIIIFSLYLQTLTKINEPSMKLSGKEDFSNFQSLEKYRDQIKLINQSFSQNDLLEKIITEIWQQKRTNVQLSGLSFSAEKREVVLAGKATTKDDLLQYKDDLEKMGLFAKVSIPLPSFKEETALDFRIILKVSL